MQVKKIIVGVAAVGLLTAIAHSAIAAQPGAYVGGQLGYGDSGKLFNGDNGGLAGRVFVGYQFNNNLAGELGWMRFHNVSADESFTYGYEAPNGKVFNGNGDAHGSLTTNIVDLTAKAIVYPGASQNINIYGKLGGAYVIQDLNVKVHDITEGYTVKANATVKNLMPTATIGIGYDFTPNLSGDVSYTRIQKVGGNNTDSLNFVGAGLAYHFA